LTSGDAPSPLTTALADRYRIERELGAGGMATVYLARDLRHDRSVAVKVLRPELAAALGSDRFLREIKTTAQLAHPHILPLHDSGEAGGFLYYVMPYVESESLRDRLTRERQLPLEEALRITREVADALGYAHSLGLVHRDIKPENILFEAGHAVVSDFGIAKAIAAAGSARLTETGLAIGTPAYMSPEQAAGSQDVDGRSDLYSLGCVLYEMLSGETPYTGPTPQAILAKKLSEPLPRISVVREAVPAGIEAALTKALARTPADRWVTAAQFAEALTATAPLPPVEAVRSKPRVQRVAAPLIGLLVVAAAVAALHESGVLWPGTRPGSNRVTSLVVLPLVNLSGDSTQEYFADGMTDALITELDKVSALTVISAHTAMLYQRSAKPVPQIARELHVQAVVEGSVQREGSRVRIGARLIDGRTDRQLWDSTYDREGSGVLALQAEVARTIAVAIGATLTPVETRRLQVHRAVNPQAYDEYLLGKHDAAALWTSENLRRAIAHYRRAIALDSTFADPQAGLVEAYAVLENGAFMPAREAGPLATVAAERAVALDPGSAGAHAAVALVRWYWQWRWTVADSEFRLALTLNPGLSDVHDFYGMLLTYLGRHDEAVQHARRAAALDPLQADVTQWLGWVCFYARRFQESIAAEEGTLALDTTYFFAHMMLGLNFSALGRHGEAIAALARALKPDPESQLALAGATIIYARAGRLAAARNFVDSLQALVRKEWVDPYLVGWAFTWLGETNRAVESFNQAIAERSGEIGGLKTEFLPEGFKADPRYHALLRRIGLE